jgi:archaellum biogenesis protein FlaJ (TadC family)
MPGKLSRNEVMAVVGAILLVVGLFLNWYESVSDLAEINGQQGMGSYTGFEVHTLIRWLLLASAIAPLVLAYIVVRDKQLSWARGEMTAVIAIIAFGLLAYNGLIDRPGEPSGQIQVEPGYFVALAGSILMMVGAALRSTESERRRKPPGTL